MLLVCVSFSVALVGVLSFANRKGMSSTRCNPNIRDEFLGHYSVMYYLKPLITVHHNP
jgi:hypothetical protein